MGEPAGSSRRYCFDRAPLRAPPLPHVVFTGGDPFKRPDLFDLIDAARHRDADALGGDQEA